MFSGIFPALLTPLTADDRVDTSALCGLIDFLLDHKVDGFYVCGSTGEGILLREEERRLVAETAIQHVAGRVPVIVHVGAPATPVAERLARHAKEKNADAVASVPPFYFAFRAKEIEEHYRRIARAAQLPVYVYNIPAATNVDMGADLMRTLFEEGLIQGLKYTAYDQLRFRQIVEACNGELNVFSGPDQMLLPFLAMGAHGGIGTTYNVMPGLYVELFEAWRAGNIERAQQLQFQADRIILVLHHFGTLSAAKAAMRLLGVDVGGPRAPLLPLTDEEQEQLEQELRQAGFFSSVPGIGA
jgi:N-acetylneuraminate lyase